MPIIRLCGFSCLWKAYLVRGKYSLASRVAERERGPRELRGLPQLVAHQPIAIDGAGAESSAEGAVGIEPGPSNGNDGARASTD